MAGSVQVGIQWLLSVCNRDTVYSQSQRTLNECAGYNGSPQYYDCSSLVSGYVYKAGYVPTYGVPAGNVMWTGNLGNILLQYGFVSVPVNQPAQQGDVLVRNLGLSDDHTEVCYSNPNNLPIAAGAYQTIGTGGSSPHSVIIKTSSGALNKPWNECYRPTNAGPPIIQKYSAYAIAAMCGCFKRESNVNPGVWEGLTPVPWDYVHQPGVAAGGFGLGQWTNTQEYGGVAYRLRDMHDWMVSNGYQPGDGDGQVQYLLVENVWFNSSQSRIPNINSLTDFLTTSNTNLPDLVWDFLANWEGVPGDAYQERLTAAQMFYQFIQDHASDPPNTWTWISTNNYLTDAEMCNNVMCIYWSLGGMVTPGGGDSGDGSVERRRAAWNFIFNKPRYARMWQNMRENDQRER